MNLKKIALSALIVTTTNASFAAENHFLRYNQATHTFNDANASVPSYDKATNSMFCKMVCNTQAKPETVSPTAHHSVSQKTVVSKTPKSTTTPKNLAFHPAQRVKTNAYTPRHYGTPLANQPQYNATDSYQPKNGLYITLKGSLAYASINNIQDASNGQYVLNYPAGTTPVNTPSASQISSGLRAGVGFNLPINSTLSIRPELEYGINYLVGYHSNSVYNPGIVGTAFNQQTLDSNILSQAGLLKLYMDMSIQNSPFLPYVMLGLGWTQNQITTTSQFEPSANAGAVILNKQTSTTNNFAWAAGIGVRYAVNSNLMFDLGYEFLNLGKLHWVFPTNTPDIYTNETITGGLQSNKYYVNSLLFGATWNF